MDKNQPNNATSVVCENELEQIEQNEQIEMIFNESQFCQELLDTWGVDLKDLR